METVDRKMIEKNCENCKYEDEGIFHVPCIDCLIETNDMWEPQDDG